MKILSFKNTGRSSRLTRALKTPIVRVLSSQPRSYIRLVQVDCVCVCFPALVTLTSRLQKRQQTHVSIVSPSLPALVILMVLMSRLADKTVLLYKCTIAKPGRKLDKHKHKSSMVIQSIEELSVKCQISNQAWQYSGRCFNTGISL